MRVAFGRIVTVAALLTLSAAPGAVPAAAAPCSSQWQVVPSANPGNSGNVLSGVFAVGSTDVWAVGHSVVTTTVAGMPSTVTDTLIEHYDGTSWSAVQGANTGGNPLLPSTAGSLDAVWGSGPTDVWAVGRAGLIEHWNGSTWSAVSAAANTQDLLGVWGSGPSDVWAVGSQTSGNATTGVTERWDGSSWSVVPGADSGAGAWAAVWGTGPGDVWAGGRPASDLDQVPVEHWDGTAWSLTTLTPGPDGVGNEVDALTDVGSGQAWNASSGGGGSQPGYEVFERWDGSAWQPIQAANEPNQGGAAHQQLYQLSGAAGSSASDVWFAGSYQPPDPNNPPYGVLPPQTYTVHFDGTQLSYVPSADVTADDDFNRVTALPGEAWAVGQSIDPSTQLPSTLVETVCASGPAAGVAETPLAQLLPLSALAATGCFLSLRRRRQARLQRR